MWSSGKDAMRLDIRLPMGLFFSVLGGLLAVFGAVSSPAIYARSLGVNVNLLWGLVLLLFGIIMMVLAYRARRRSERQGAG
jgi:ABC-type Fe3+-siderophore transport system permease subunit